MYLGNHITLETMIIIDKLNPYLDHWKQNMSNLFADDIRLIVKAKPFVKFDVNKVSPIFSEFLKEF